jgi:hypothetical protein
MPQGGLIPRLALTIMHHGGAGRRSTPTFARLAVEDHGRVVITDIRAAFFYRHAQQAPDSPHALTALRLAIRADPGFGLAVADLGALAEGCPAPVGGAPGELAMPPYRIGPYRRRQPQSSRRLAP